MSSAGREVLYVADPMCSWCWGFASVLSVIEERLAPDVSLRTVLGGLAPDSDEPMPEAVRDYVRSAWDAVEAATGARFERRFWTENEPRRSTWISCRACLAAEDQRVGAGRAMFQAIQRAYYLEARNPSLAEVLVDLARGLGLDPERFRQDLDAQTTQAALRDDFALRDALGATGFPSLALREGERATLVMRGWRPAEEVLPRLEQAGWIRPGN